MIIDAPAESSLLPIRARIVRQLLIESLVLAAAGGLAGWTLACAMVRAAPALIPAATLPQAIVLSADMRLATFAAIVSIATGLVFGSAPAWHAVLVPPAAALTSGGRMATRTACLPTHRIASG